MEWTLRPAGPDEWEEARRLRLEMLADTPIAYGFTLARAEARTDAEWQEVQRRAAEDGTHHVVVVGADGRWLGQAVGKDEGPVTPEQPEPPGVFAVYLTPAARGAGALGAMVDDVARWLAGRGHDRMTLMVHEDNHRAIRAYEKLGFRLTGDWCPYDNDPTRRELTMERDL